MNDGIQDKFAQGPRWIPRFRFFAQSRYGNRTRRARPRLDKHIKLLHHLHQRAPKHILLQDIPRIVTSREFHILNIGRWDEPFGIFGEKQYAEIRRTILLPIEEPQGCQLFQNRTVIRFDHLRIYRFRQIEPSKQIKFKIFEFRTITWQFFIPHAIPTSPFKKQMNVLFACECLAWPDSDPNLSVIPNRRIFRRKHRQYDNIPFWKCNLLDRHGRWRK